MKSDVVDCWIGHWLKIQKKNKHPLVLKNGSDSKSDKRANPITVSWRRWNKGKDRYIDSDDTDDEAAANDETTDEADDNGQMVMNMTLAPTVQERAGKVPLQQRMYRALTTTLRTRAGKLPRPPRVIRS